MTCTLKDNPCIVKVLDISTAHITKRDSFFISKATSELIQYEYKEGFFIYVLEDKEETQEALLKAGYSQAFVDIINRARELGCKYVQLDCDGITYDDLPTFEW